jgi:hypothetical protein
MSDGEDSEDNGSDISYNSEFEESSDVEESNEASHEVRVMAFQRMMREGSGRNALCVSVSPSWNESLPPLEEMPEGFQLETDLLEEEVDEREEDLANDNHTGELDEESNGNGWKNFGKDQDEQWEVYYVWSCNGYKVELYGDKDDPSYYRMRVLRRPRLEIINTGHLHHIQEIHDVCRHLEEDEFEDAMRILFRVYGGGTRDGEERTEEELERVIEESRMRSTTSGLD